ncbi:HAD family phosphatase [Pseudoalteromonas shioyasakiensis]|uniref:HAD family hydrolase n=1 Tax=Pseudoalteromonas shioyasakiensis TaxID=1190813 RepID=UPI002117EE1B|nr:HAD family phosphatase [Pseudoalteromonas shioyasakiensis]MCQ8878709.1 HAD family phosphatase [Pseudoalteromonas shioyasakiensis]
MTDNVELIIFDCDGVVIDSEIISARVLIQMLSDLGIHIDTHYVQQHFLGCSFKTVSEKIASAFGVDLPSQFESDYRNTLVTMFAEHLQPTAGIKNILLNLNVPFCIATSSSLLRTQKALHAVGFDSLFKNIFTSEEVALGKPAPDLFLHAAATMNVSAKNCLVIEDSSAGVQAALSAGMQVMHYFGGQHLNRGVNHVHINFPDVALLDHWQSFFAAFPTLTHKSLL